MIGLVVTDSHFEGSKLNNQLISLDNLIREYQPDYIIHGGDLCRRGDVGDMAMPASDIIHRIADRITQWGIPWIIAAGNHDYVNKACALDFFHHPLVTAVKRPAFFQFEEVAHEFLILPWIHGQAKQTEEWLKKQKPRKNPLIIVGHADLMGFSHHGKELTKQSSAFCLDPKAWAHLKPAAAWFGHIHDQNLREQQGFLGSVWSTNFREVDHLGCVGVIDESMEHELQVDTVGRYVLRHIDWQTPSSRTWGNFQTNPGPPVYYIRLSGSEISDVMASKPEDLNVEFTVCRPRKESLQKELKIKGEVSPTQTFKDYLKEKGIKSTTELLALWERFRPEFSDRSISIPPIEQITLKELGRFNTKMGYKEVILKFTAGLNVITGKNGSGKTSIVESIPLCLYGSFPDARQVGQMVNKESRIDLLAGGITYSRGWKEPKYCIDKPVTDSEYATGVSQVFSTQELFLATTFVSQKRTSSLVRAKSTARMEVLRELYGLQEFDAKHALVKAEVKRYAGQEMLQQLAAAKITELTSGVETLKAEIASEADHLKKQLAEAEKLQAAAQATYSALEKIQKRLKGLRQERISTVGLFQAKWREFIENPCRKYSTEMTVYKQALEKYQARAEKAGCSKSGLIKDCPLLQEPEKPRRPFWWTFFKGVTIPSLDEKLPTVDFSGSQESHRNQWNTLCGIHASHEVQSSALKKLEDAEGDIPTKCRDASLAQEKAGQGAGAARERLNNLRKGLDAAEKYLAKAVQDEKTAAANVVVLRNAEILEQTLSPYGLSQWHLEKMLPDLQDRVNEILAQESLDIHVQVRFDFSANKNPRLEIYVTTEEGEFPVEAVSGGQETLVSLAVWLALSGTLLILDEPLTALHPDSARAVAGLLLEHAQSKQIIVISHEPTLVTHADSVLDVGSL